MKKWKLSLIALSLLISSVSFGQILTFEFVSLAGNETSAASNSNDPNLTSSTITRGSGLTASNNGQRFNATNWSITSIDDAVSNDKYMQFTITPNIGYQFNISSIFLNIQRSSTGPSAIALRSSVDNYATNLDQIYSITDNTSTQSFTFTFAQSNSSTAVTYRVYMYAESTGGSGGIGDGSGDDIIVTGTTSSTGAAPTITTSETELTGFTYNVGSGPSASQSFTVSGSDLTANIAVTPPTNYEISLNNTAFQSTAITLNHTAGTVNTTTIYARLKTGLAIGNYNTENITVSSAGASSKTVACSGRVEGAQTTTLPYSQDFSSDFGKVYVYDESGAANWYLSGAVAHCNGYPNNDGVDLDWMVLPRIDFSAYTDVELSFDLWWRYGNQDADNYLKVLYSTNYAGFGNPNSATWTELSYTIPAEQTWASTGIIDLSSLTSSTVYIAFKYRSDASARYWQLDNILVQEEVIVPPPPPAANAWINEIHYDNVGADSDEIVEVVIENASSYTLSDFAITLYNGGNGALYKSKTLDLFTVGSTTGNYTFYYFNFSTDGGLQNGSPDGLALDWKGNLIQFLSYEGTFTAVDGPASGILSTDINVTEDGSTPVGNSLQLQGTGLIYSHFTWVDPVSNAGNPNGGQFFGPPPPAVPLDWKYMILFFFLITGVLIYRKLT